MPGTNPEPRLWLRWATALFAVIVLLATARISFQWGKERGLAQQQTQPELKPAPPPPPPRQQSALSNLPPGTVTAAQVLDDYRTNDVAAKRQFNGRPFFVVGTVSGVHDDFGSTYLELMGEDQLGRPSNFFVLDAFLQGQAQKQQASRLDPGDTVLLQCNASTKLGEPYLSGCVITKQLSQRQAG